MLYLKIERNKSGARKDRRSVIAHFSAKNIPFENGGFHSIQFHSKSPGQEGPNVGVQPLFSQNIPFKFRKIFRRDIVITLVYTSIIPKPRKMLRKCATMATCPRMSFFAFCVGLLKHDFFAFCD